MERGEGVGASTQWVGELRIRLGGAIGEPTGFGIVWLETILFHDLLRGVKPMEQV
jgi:hypothetical protein